MGYRTEVAIVGAGMAGLAAAERLKEEGVDFHLFEAAREPGGRALSVRSPNGNWINLGPQWNHGRERDNVLAQRVRQEGLPRIPRDPGTRRVHYVNGERLPGDSPIPALLDEVTSHYEHAPKSVLRRTSLETAIRTHAPELEPYARKLCTYFGTDDLGRISLFEVQEDPFESGGQQLAKGMRSLIERIGDYAGWSQQHYNAPITHIHDRRNEVLLRTQNNRTCAAGKVIFTGSVETLRKAETFFEPGLDLRFRRHLKSQTMGDFLKIGFDLHPGFAARHPELVNTRHDDWSPTMPLVAYVMPGNAATLTLTFAGSTAVELEKRPRDVLERFARGLMARHEGLAPFLPHLMPTPPEISRWHSNPYTQGAYTALAPGGFRTGPWERGNIVFAGEAFDTYAPGHLAGAYQSGRDAADHVIDLLRNHAYDRGRSAGGVIRSGPIGGFNFMAR